MEHLYRNLYYRFSDLHYNLQSMQLVTPSTQYDTIKIYTFKEKECKAFPFQTIYYLPQKTKNKIVQT